MYKYGSGDTGVTAIAVDERGSKNDDVIRLYGALDELAAMVNLVQVHLADAERYEVLQTVIKDLYNISARIYLKPTVVVTVEMLDTLEQTVEKYREHTIKEFIKFNHVVPAYLNLARTVCRRAELQFFNSRLAVYKKYATVGVYLNRLSSLLFHLAASFHNNSVIKEL